MTVEHCVKRATGARCMAVARRKKTVICRYISLVTNTLKNVEEEEEEEEEFIFHIITNNMQCNYSK